MTELEGTILIVATIDIDTTIKDMRFTIGSVFIKR
jgi:hypothetical protein